MTINFAVSSDLGWLHRVFVSSNVDVSEVPSATIFKGPQFTGRVSVTSTARFDRGDGDSM